MVFGLKLNAFKAGFFDRKKVQNAVDRATRRNLSRFGAFVRRRAKSSIRKRKKSSRPGSPPSSHTGIYKRLIFFAYDARIRSVVIGPTLFRTGSKVPSLLEKGGIVRRKDGRKGAVEVFRHRARPHMGPAFRAEAANINQLWKNSIRGA